MDWVEITVHTNTAGSDMVSDLLMRHGASGTAIEDRNDAGPAPQGSIQWDLMDEDLIDKMPVDVLVHGYIPSDERANERITSLTEALSELPKYIGFDAGALALSIANVRDEDWAENWKKHYKPFRVGKRIVVKPIWEPYCESPDDLVIEIDPGMAFGNGTHETTSMCLSLLETHVKPGDDVLDVGTGSGILSIAAAKLGASRVCAVDLDPVAVSAAKENVKHNKLSGIVSVGVSNLLDDARGQADVVVANIIADIIILLSKPVRTRLKPGGVFIASGIIRDREQEVLSALKSAGFTVDDIRRDGEWVAIVSKE